MRDKSRGPRAEGREWPPAEGGFTLLEVVVAIVLLAVILTTALELLGVGLRSAKTAGDYTQGVLLARQKLGELSEQKATARVLDGTVGEAYRWTAEVTPEGGDTEGLPVRLFKLRVKVSWAGKGGEKGVELVTLRTAMEEEKAGTPRRVTR